MELEFKYIAPYLPYGLKIQGQTHGEIAILSALSDTCVQINNKSMFHGWWADILDIKPILRPLSDLTKEVEVGGERFVPIFELGQDIFYNWLKKEVEFMPSSEEESHLESQLIPDDFDGYFNIKPFDNHTFFGITFYHPDFDSDNRFDLHENTYTIDKNVQKSTGCLTFGYKRKNKYVLDFKGFVTMWSIPAYRSVMKFELKHWQKLFEWHFDVFGLIEQGLAIDINKIDE